MVHNELNFCLVTHPNAHRLFLLSEQFAPKKILADIICHVPFRVCCKIGEQKD